MDGPQQYTAAERDLALVERSSDLTVDQVLKVAEVRATLALAAATALTGGGLPGADYTAWNEVAGVASPARKAMQRAVARG